MTPKYKPVCAVDLPTHYSATSAGKLTLGYM